MSHETHDFSAGDPRASAAHFTTIDGYACVCVQLCTLCTMHYACMLPQLCVKRGVNTCESSDGRHLSMEVEGAGTGGIACSPRSCTVFQFADLTSALHAFQCEGGVASCCGAP